MRIFLSLLLITSSLFVGFQSAPQISQIFGSGGGETSNYLSSPVNLAGSDITGTLAVGNGGTGATTLTDNGVLVGSGSSALTALSVGTNGQVLIGSSGADPVFASLNASRSLTTTTGAGTLQIDADAELYTYTIGANLFATTTANGIATTTEDFLSIPIANASTITGFRCYTDQSGTSTIQSSISTDGASAGSAVFYNDYAGFNGIECGSSQENATTTFQNSAISANDWLHLWVSDAGPYSIPPETIYISFTATKND